MSSIDCMVQDHAIRAVNFQLRCYEMDATVSLALKKPSASDHIIAELAEPRIGANLPRGLVQNMDSGLWTGPMDWTVD